MPISLSLSHKHTPITLHCCSVATVFYQKKQSWQQNYKDWVFFVVFFFFFKIYLPICQWKNLSGLPENNNTDFNTRKRSVPCIILGTRKVSDSQKRDQKTWMVLRRHYHLEKRLLYFIEEKELEDSIRSHDAHMHQRYQSETGSSL